MGLSSGYGLREKVPGTSESVLSQPCSWAGFEPAFTRSNRTLRHGQINDCPCREQAIAVRKCSTTELHALLIGCAAGVEPATSRGQSEVTVIYTTAKPAPGMLRRGLHAPPGTHSRGEK